LDIGPNALGLDRAAGRREIPRRGEPQRAVARAEWNDGLYRTLAEGARADDGAPLVVLQRACDDLRSRSRAAVDQHDERLAVDEIAGPGVEALGLLRVAAAGRDDLAPLQKRIRHRDRLIEQSARIIAQVEHVALELFRWYLRGEIVDRLL